MSRELQMLRRSYRVLHIAPERSIRDRLQHFQNLTYLTADRDMPQVAVHADLERLPFEEGSFDVVICSHVLEHIREDQQGMAEMRRVLAPGGQALIMVPVDPERVETYEDPAITEPEARLQAFGRADHVRVYGTDVIHRLEASRFTVDPVDYAEHLPPGEAEHVVATAGELIYVCRRSAAPRSS